ncbi:MAG TPA: GDSL-type esterase/lipase family protein [Syntrophorhabdales bacterium]|nr:GDSL-type esterase/lipase family protein [Syntrophorhabdales bacterium]
MVKAIFLVFFSLLIALAITEAALRAIHYSYSPLKIEVKGNPNDWRLKHSFQDRHFVYDPDLIWRPEKNNRVFNAQGYMGKELPAEKNDHEYRIVAIGDSNTLGWFGKERYNWPRYLEELLASRDKTFFVVNAGVWGYASYQGEKRFEESLSLKPDMVLISFGANDAHMVAVSDAEFTTRVFSRYKAFLYRFRVGQLIIAFLEKAMTQKKESGKDELVHRVSVEEYKHNLTKIVEISKKNNIVCILLTRPFIGKPHDRLSWKYFAPEYVKATVEVGKETGAPVVDIYSYFKDKEQYFADESHFNEDGHKFAAKVIYDQIESLLPGSALTNRQSKKENVDATFGPNASLNEVLECCSTM